MARHRGVDKILLEEMVEIRLSTMMCLWGFIKAEVHTHRHMHTCLHTCRCVHSAHMYTHTTHPGHPSPQTLGLSASHRPWADPSPLQRQWVPGHPTAVGQGGEAEEATVLPPGRSSQGVQRWEGSEVELAEPLQQVPPVATLRLLHRVGRQVHGRGKR